MQERIGNRVIPIASIVGVVLIMGILTSTRHGPGDDRASLTPVDEGRKIYNLICISCHDPDPTKDRVGESYGPPVAGSSLELLELRVLDTKYPAGYVPKRNTSNMSAFPLSGTQLRALHAFLKDAAKKAGHPK